MKRPESTQTQNVRHGNGRMYKLGGEPKTGLFHKFLATFRRVFKRKTAKQTLEWSSMATPPQDLHTPHGNVVGDESITQETKIEGGTAIGITQVAGDYHYHPSLPTPIDATAPAPPPHFVGRQAELDALAHLLTSDDTPQPTIALVGMGGIGKTALAAQSVNQLRSAFPGGIFWADLRASDGDPLPILATWTVLCRYNAETLRDFALTKSAQMVRGVLEKRVTEEGCLLIVLDDVHDKWLNGVRILESARPSGVPILLTTRDKELAVALNATTIHHLDGLSSEEGLDLMSALLAARSDLLEQEPDAGRRLVERVEGLPLALELFGKSAAKYADKPGWQLGNLLEELEAHGIESLRLKGQTDLTVTFSLSYKALKVKERQLFRVLGAFAPAPFTAEHVAAIAGWKVRETERGLDALVQMCLTRWEKDNGEGACYALHPLLRDYAAMLLEEAGEKLATRTAHTEHYLAYAEAQIKPGPIRHGALGVERGNIQAALRHAYQHERWAQQRDLLDAIRDTLTVYGIGEIRSGVYAIGDITWIPALPEGEALAEDVYEGRRPSLPPPTYTIPSDLLRPL